MIKLVRSVRIQLSNICNMAHKECPISTYTENVHLPIKYVRSVIDNLETLGYSGDIGFHIYNEPTIDPRLFYIMKYANEKLPESKVVLWTNGKAVTEGLVEDFSEIKNLKYYLSCYAGVDAEPLLSEDSEKTSGELDDRLGWYDRPERSTSRICRAPYSQVTIDYNGNVIICCMDWKSSVVFGNIKNSSLGEILESEYMKKTAGELSSGNRTHELCKRCGTGR